MAPRKRRSSAPLVHLLDDAPGPIYLLDATGKIVFANRACGEWLGVDPQSLSGQVCRYAPPASGKQQGEVADGLCPPPRVFRGHACQELVYAPPGSEPAQQSARFVPLPGKGEECGVLVLVGESAVQASEAAQAPPEREECHELHQQVREFMGRYRGWYSLERLAGESAAARRIREQVQLAAGTASRVVVLGPRGSGREHVARAIHYVRAESDALMPLSCPMLDGELLESMVGKLIARRAELGAEGSGALLLLEIDQLPFDAQTRLLSILKLEELELRCLATAREPLTDLAQRGAFDAELAHRLSTVEIELVPLAQRAEDIPLLAQMCLEELNRQAAPQLDGFTTEALDRLVAYGWPGNIDELMQIVEQAHRQAAGTLVASEDLPRVLRFAEQAEALPPRKVEGPIELDALLAEAEAELIRRALARAKGNRAEAARSLSISRPRLLRRIEQLEIEATD